MDRPVRFVHTADLHLDAPFQGIRAVQQRVAEELIESTYAAFARVVDVCVERDVDFLVIAGDVYNSRDKSLRAQIRFQHEMERLAQAGIPVFVVSGNHDPASGWSAGLRLPDTVHQFPADRIERVVVEREGRPACVLYGRGYATSAVTENLAAGYRRDASDQVAIGVLHSNVGGQPGYEPYAPCSVDDLRAARMDYWALGHIHKPMDLSEDPPARYSGSPQGLNPNEDGAHGCYVVEIASGTARSEFVLTARVVWSKRELPLAEEDGIEDVRTAIRAACDAEREAAAGVPVVARFDLSGRTRAHADVRLAERLEQLLADAREEQMSETPWVWIDRVRDLTSPVIDIDAVRRGADLASDLVGIADELLADPAECSALVKEVTRALASSVGELGLDACETVARARDACLDELVGEDAQ